jgi:hypothetical protein
MSAPGVGAGAGAAPELGRAPLRLRAARSQRGGEVDGCGASQ